MLFSTFMIAVAVGLLIYGALDHTARIERLEKKMAHLLPDKSDDV